MSEKILVVDDERPIADILAYNLERAGYQVVVAHDGRAALKLAACERPDLIVLDIMLPQLDGLSVCREIRQSSQVPILMLTAREEEVDRVVGLELGADDYVTKPFSPRELLARVRAILRRAGSQPADDGRGDGWAEGRGYARPTGLLRAGPLTIDLEGYAVQRDGRELALTPREFELLRFLAQHPGQVFSREALCREVWGYEYFGDARTVDVTIRRLREKVEADPSQPQIIKTRRGVGYFLPRA